MSETVIVIGIGGMGASACYHLARREFRVIGLEQFLPAHDQGSSHGETRMIRKAYFEHPDYVPLLKRSYELWAELSQKSARQLYHQTGIFYSLNSTSQICLGIQKSAKLYGIPLSRISSHDTVQWQKYFHFAETQSQFFEPEAGYLEVENCTHSHIQLAKQLGAELHFNESVIDITFNSGASPVVVRTNRRKYVADKIVFTAGAWTSQVLQNLNLPLKVRRKVLSWFPVANGCGRIARDIQPGGMPCFFIENAKGQSYYGFPDIGTGEIKCAEHSGGEDFAKPSDVPREVSATDLNPLSEFVGQHLPGVNVQSIRASVCMYTMTPDEHFILDRHPLHPAAYMACGFSGHGYKFASVIGECLADLVQHGKTSHPIDFLGLQRLVGDIAPGT